MKKILVLTLLLILINPIQTYAQNNCSKQELEISLLKSRLAAEQARVQLLTLQNSRQKRETSSQDNVNINKDYQNLVLEKQNNQKRIFDLQNELAAKNIVITNNNKTISSLNNTINNIKKTNKERNVLSVLALIGLSLFAIFK